MHIQIVQIWRAVYRKPNGEVGWTWEGKNLVPDAWINALLNGTVTYGNALYVLLIDNAGFSAYAASDTMASHPGWTEFTSYFESTRPVATLSTATAKSRDNLDNPAVFSISASGTVRGLGVTTYPYYSSPLSGVLGGEVDFTGGSQAVEEGGTLEVTVQISMASA